MTDDRKEDDALEALFSASRTRTPEMSDDFMARLMADADAAAPQPAPVAKPVSALVSNPVPTPAFGNLKAWFAASGLSGAAVLGMWIGFVMPEMVNTVALSDDVSLYAFLPGADLTIAELGE